MNKKKILEYSNWNGRDLFHYCLAKSFTSKEDKMFAIEIEDSGVADRMLDIYGMDDANFYNALTPRKLEKGISAIAETISLLYSSEYTADAIREDGLSNKCFEEIKKLERVVAELSQFAKTIHYEEQTKELN